MAYVALSRVRSIAGLHITDYKQGSIYCDEEVQGAISDMKHFKFVSNPFTNVQLESFNMFRKDRSGRRVSEDGSSATSNAPHGGVAVMEVNHRAPPVIGEEAGNPVIGEEGEAGNPVIGEEGGKPRNSPRNWGGQRWIGEKREPQGQAVTWLEDPAQNIQQMGPLLGKEAELGPGETDRGGTSHQQKDPAHSICMFQSTQAYGVVDDLSRRYEKIAIPAHEKVDVRGSIQNGKNHRACPMAEKRMLLLLFLTAYICGIVTLGTISKRMGCNCSDKGATISNFKYFEINELKEVEQRRKAELRKFKIRTETTKETLMIVNGSVPLSYPVQGVVVAPEEWENILGLRVDDYTVHEHYKSKHTCVFERIKVASVCAYQVKLSSSKFGVLDARATVPGVNVDGLGTTLLNMSSRSLDHLNRQLEFVVYVNTVFDIDARDYVHFVYLQHEVVFPIVVRVRKAPILYDLEPGDINNKVTIITKTFLRYSSVRLLLQSIQKYYPKMRVVVADDSRPIEDLQSEYVDHYVMPFASGWFGGRNLAVSQVTTPYLLWVDDDFVFTEETKLEVMVDILDNSNLDLPAIAEPTKHYHLTLGMYEPYH
ncbi:Beta-1,4 N-acetylgalactosaminyltransferase 1 [Branchiostoma belcheri]|nr:Beta-1,4 N-acetylgalactosaminyltransferase 1 [Branchiostoma belcheri]